jgi:DNA-binding transcriptional regulator YiaG
MVIHDMAKSLYKIGAIDSAKMREFDADCLVSTPEIAQNPAETEYISPVTAEI